MRIVTLNLRRGGGTRIAAIGDYLLEHNAEVLVCTEIRTNEQGRGLGHRFANKGYRSFHAPTDDARQNAVTWFVRGEVEPVGLFTQDADKQRFVGCRVRGLFIAGIYFAQLKQKASLFDYLLSRPLWFGTDALIVGDFNSGRHRHEEASATFVCADKFGGLPLAGFEDLSRSDNGEGAREYCWLANRGGGFHIDHAFGSGSIPERLIACRYDHSTWEKLTDHSALIVEIGA